MSLVVRCILPAACRMLSGCCLLLLHVVCRVFPCCISSVALSLMHVACCQLSVAHFPVVVCGIAGRWIVSACPFFVACRTFSVACPMSHLVTLHVVRCESSDVCCMTHVLCCMLSLGRCMAHRACRLPHAVCCPLQSGTVPSDTQRNAAALATERLCCRRGPLQTEVCVRACVCACLRVGSTRDGVSLRVVRA
jgi:hypothetical protein